MAESLRDHRAAEIAKYLMEVKIPQTKEQITAHFKWGHSGTHRSMEIVERWGILTIDRTRMPYTYQYKQGSSFNFFPPITFFDNPEPEINVRDLCNSLVARTTEDWKTPALDLEGAVFYATIFGMGIEEMEYRQLYEELLDAIAAKYRQSYLTYRLAKTIKQMSPKERSLQRYGIENRLPGQEKDDTMTMAMNFQYAIKKLLEGLK